MNSPLMNECHMKIAQSTWNCFFNPPKWIVYLHDPEYQHPRTLTLVLDLDERWYPTSYEFISPININERERYIYISTVKFINPRTIVVINISMAISGSQNSVTVPYTAIFWGIFPEIKAWSLGIIYIYNYMVGTSNQSVPEMAIDYCEPLSTIINHYEPVLTIVIPLPIGSMVLVYMITFGVYWWDPCYHI